MQAGVLKALLDNVAPETEVIIDMLDYDVEVAGISYNEQYGSLFIIAVEDESPSDDEPEDESCGDMCDVSEDFASLPEPRSIEDI